MTCPGCRQAMAAQALDGRYGRQVDLDLCHGCGVLGRLVLTYGPMADPADADIAAALNRA